MKRPWLGRVTGVPRSMPKQQRGCVKRSEHKSEILWNDQRKTAREKRRQDEFQSPLKEGALPNATALRIAAAPVLPNAPSLLPDLALNAVFSVSCHGSRGLH